MEKKIILSPTRARVWVRCKKQNYWRYVCHLTKVRKTVPLALGSVVGEALAIYYSSPSRDQPVLNTSLETVFAKVGPEFLGPEPDGERVGEWNKVVGVSKTLLSNYHQWASTKDTFSKVLSVERPYTIKLSPRVSLLAIPDTVVLEGDFPMVLEHKVRSRYRPGDFGIDYQSVACALVSGSIGTLYNILEYSRPKFHREAIVRTQPELDFFRGLFISMGEDILSTSPEKMYPSPMKRCSCDYWELCRAEFGGLDIEDIIAELYQERARTSPTPPEPESVEEES